ncbi:MAG: tail fiber domain-containing protein [Candidatus Delongbacteria bacterium]|nr:tail fiber domain-containing protein [Candidatus Delongbacteria bacterium]
MRSMTTVLTLIVFSLTISAQNITNTLGTGGDYIIRDAAKQYLTFKQSTGLMGLGEGVIMPRAQLEIGGIEGLLVTGTLGSGTALNLGSGSRLHWYPKKAAFRVGRVEGNQWDEDSIGTYSVAMGYNTKASGNYSTAMGYQTTASAKYSTAMGWDTQASGYSSTAMGVGTRASNLAATAMGNRSIATGIHSTAMGYQTTASAKYSTAMGRKSIASGDSSSTAIGDSTVASGVAATAIGHQTQASGNYSIAMGHSSIASGSHSVAIGTKADTKNYDGAMVLTDYSEGLVTTEATAHNQMTMRFCGGYRLFTNSNHTTGVYMNAGESGWSNYSNRNKKENFQAIDNETLLNKLRAIPVTRWNYKGSPNIDYIGPMAQDFYAVFHLGGEDSLGINSICIDGITLAGVKAMEERTRTMKSTIDSITIENHEIKNSFNTIQAENQQIKTAFSTIQTELKNLTGESKQINQENKELSGRIDQLACDNWELKAQLARVTEALDRLAAREKITSPDSKAPQMATHSDAPVGALDQ